MVPGAFAVHRSRFDVRRSGGIDTDQDAPKLVGGRERIVEGVALWAGLEANTVGSGCRACDHFLSRTTVFLRNGQVQRRSMTGVNRAAERRTPNGEREL